MIRCGLLLHRRTYRVRRLKVVEVGKDQDGEPIIFCVIEPADVAPIAAASETRLTPNQQTMFLILHAAGARGLSFEDLERLSRGSPRGMKVAARIANALSACPQVGPPLAGLV